MTVALGVLGVLVCVWAWTVRDQQRRCAAQLDALRVEAAAERQVLLERIQRPDRPMSLPGAPTFDFPDAEPDEAHLVGTIAFVDDDLELKREA